MSDLPLISDKFRVAKLRLFKSRKPWKDLVIVHNLPDQRGLCIDDCLDNWIARTEDYTEESLVEYINSKRHYGFQAYTVKDWERDHGRVQIENENFTAKL